MCVACTMKNAPSLISLKEDASEPTVQDLPIDGEPEVSIVAAFDRRGEHIITGSSKGKILIIDPSTLLIKKQFRIGVTTVRSIEFMRRGNRFLINSSDRIIRVFDLNSILELQSDSDPEPVQKLQDTVSGAYTFVF